MKTMNVSLKNVLDQLSEKKINLVVESTPLNAGWDESNCHSSKSGKSNSSCAGSGGGGTSGSGSSGASASGGASVGVSVSGGLTGGLGIGI